MKTNRKNGRQINRARTKSFHRFAAFGLVIVLFAGLAVACFISYRTSKRPAIVQKVSTLKLPRTLPELLALKPDELEGTDIALMNLLCAQGLPGAENLNLDECLATLDQWAQHAK